MMNEKIVDALRTKYQYDMKKSVSLIDSELNNPTTETIINVDRLIGEFYEAKEKASYLEAIIKNLKGEE